METQADSHQDGCRLKAPPSIVAPLELVGRSGRSKAHDRARLRGTSDGSPHALPETSAGGGGAQPKVEVSRMRVRRGPQAGLVAEAVAWIRSKVAETLKLGAIEVGEYVLVNFFQNNPDLVRSRDPYKAASFRALSSKCGTPELPISKTWLNNAVGVALITRLLPQDAHAFRSLPPSYQEALLPLTDPSAVESLAKQAAARQLTFRELRRLVADERRSRREESTSPRSPAKLLKLLDRWAQYLDINGSRNSIATSDIDSLDRAQCELAMQRVSQLAGELEDLTRMLKARRETDRVEPSPMTPHLAAELDTSGPWDKTVAHERHRLSSAQKE